MTQITVDQQMGEQFRSSTDDVLVVDEEGRVLGVFHPILQPPYPAEWIPPISDEELERSFADPRRYTTEEVLKHLEGA